MQDFQKKAGEKLDYVIDYSRYLNGDAIVESSWEATPSTGITLDDPTSSFTPTSTTVWVSGGTPGQKYVVENTIETASGRVVIDEIYIYIKEVSS